MKMKIDNEVTAAKFDVCAGVPSMEIFEVCGQLTIFIVLGRGEGGREKERRRGNCYFVCCGHICCIVPHKSAKQQSGMACIFKVSTVLSSRGKI